jgi:hypothetical protein
MLILGIIEATLILIICVAIVVEFRNRYKRAVARGKLAEEKLREVTDAARVAAGQPPIPGSGVDRSEMRPPPPDPPPNRTSTGRVQAQPRQRPRPRQSVESSFSNLFNGFGEQMNQAFAGVSQAVSNISEQASQIASVSTNIARDAQTLLDLGFVGDMIELDQGRRSNLQHLSLTPRIRPQTIRALQELETSNRAAEHMNWGQLVREFMRMIESGELTFTETSNVSLNTRVSRGQQRRAETSPTVQSPAKEPEPDKPPPTRFEREDVI